MIRFASIRFKRVLEGKDRSSIADAIGSRGARATSWAIVGERTYALLESADAVDSRYLCDIDAQVCDPASIVLRIRPMVSARLEALARVLCGPGNPGVVSDAFVADGEVLAELVPTGRALHLLLTLVDTTLAATPGRTIVPVLPIDDEVLASFGSLRLLEPDLDVSRVLEPYVEALLRPAEARA